MDSPPHPQIDKLRRVVETALDGQDAAHRGMLFASSAGLALVEAAFQLFECDGLYDLGLDVRHELALDWQALLRRSHPGLSPPVPEEPAIPAGVAQPSR